MGALRRRRIGPMPEARRTILVIDDDPEIRDTMVEVLRAEGYPVDMASNGREGLAKLDAIQTPCLVVLDMMMPVLDGMGFLEAVARRANADDIHVLVVTANPAMFRQIEPPRVIDLLKKPFELDDMLGVVAAYCAS